MIILSGCATTENYRALLETWKGNNINAYIASNGSPNSTLPLPNGDMVYTWNKTFRRGSYSNTTHLPVSTPYSRSHGYNYDSDYTDTLYYAKACKTDIFTNSKGEIINYRFEGNHCKAN